MRAFIIGNGPSLTLDTLKLLQNEVTFGVNRIHLLYEGIPEDWINFRQKVANGKSIWQASGANRKKMPDLDIPYAVKHFVWMEWEGHDDLEWREAVGIHSHMGAKLHLSAGHKGHYFNAHMRRYEVPKTVIQFYELCEHGADHADEPKPSEWHKPVVCRYGGSLAGAIQIAAWEGYNPLYLVGCDLDFKDGKLSHFSEKYEEGRDQLPAKTLNKIALWAHNVAFRSSPVPIINCTLAGKLDVFPRQALEEVIANGTGL